MSDRRQNICKLAQNILFNTIHLHFNYDSIYIFQQQNFQQMHMSTSEDILKCKMRNFGYIVIYRKGGLKYQLIEMSNLHHIKTSGGNKYCILYKKKLIRN